MWEKRTALGKKQRRKENSMGKRTALKDGEKEECSIGKKKSIGIKKNST